MQHLVVAQSSDKEIKLNMGAVSFTPMWWNLKMDPRVIQIPAFIPLAKKQVPVTHSKIFQTISGQVKWLQPCEVLQWISKASNFFTICSRQWQRTNIICSTKTHS